MKQLGNVRSIELNITKPIKMEIQEMALNKIMILVGQNGSGKTFLLKMVWLLQSCVNFMLIARAHGFPTIDEVANAQFLGDNTYVDNNLTGTVTMNFEFGDKITIEAEEGKILSVKSYIDDEIEPGAQPVFMSKDMRLFSDIVNYMKFKKVLGLSKGIPTIEVDMKKLLDMYRIYDIIYVEQLLIMIETRTSKDLLDKLNETLKNFDEDFQLTDLTINFDKPDIVYSDTTHTNISTTTLAAGHQSILNMFGFQHYQSTKI